MQDDKDDDWLNICKKRDQKEWNLLETSCMLINITSILKIVHLCLFSVTSLNTTRRLRHNNLITHLTDKFVGRFSPQKIKLESPLVIGSISYVYLNWMQVLFTDTTKAVESCTMTANLVEEIVQKRQNTLPRRKEWGKEQEKVIIITTKLLCLSLLQVYNARKTLLKPGKEETLRKEIDWQFMTDKTSREEGELVRHPLPWRSRGIFVAFLWVCCSVWQSHGDVMLNMSNLLLFSTTLERYCMRL